MICCDELYLEENKPNPNGGGGGVVKAPPGHHGKQLIMKAETKNMKDCH